MHNLDDGCSKEGEGSEDGARKMLLRGPGYAFGRAVQNWINEWDLNSLDP
jgi:hypothetical protein